MTKEELKQKAIENVRNRFSVCKNRNDDFILDNFGAEVEALVQFAQSQLTEKDKQIQIDAEQIRALQKQNGELTDKARDLEAQIEKMKCCGNCTKGNCVNIGQKGKACAYWTFRKD